MQLLSAFKVPRVFDVQWFVVVVLFAITMFLVQDTIAQPSHLRVVNGYDATTRREWMASLSPAGTNPYRTHFCGGTVIDARTVVTAAHCVVDFAKAPHKLQVMVGRERLSSTGEGRIIKASGVIVHPRYRVDKFSNDIALVKLSSDVLLSQYPAVPTQFNLQNESGYATILGWGIKDPNKYQRSNMLQEAEIPLVNDKTCKKRMGADYNSGQMICGGTLSSSEQNVDGVDSCNGDSGGPLIATMNNKIFLAGITSWGIDCASTYFWGVYARTDVHRDWIYSNPPIPPYAITPPRIIGKALRGHTLRCKPGTWGGDDAPVHFRWIDAKKGVIKGARTSTYRLHRRDAGKTLICEVRKQSVRQTAYARSKKVGPVRAA